MTTVADLVTAFHDIDALKGKMCKTCKFRDGWELKVFPKCLRGQKPIGVTDGCDDWQPQHNPDRATMAVVMSV
jgi:hypothetical protein